MSGGGMNRYSQQQTGPGNLWTGQTNTQIMQPRGQTAAWGMPGSGGIAGYGGYQGYQQGWPGAGYGGMPNRYGGGMGAPGYGMGAWGNPFSGFSGGYNPYGPGSYSAPGAMPYGGGSGMYGGGSYNMMANQMAGIPYQQMARSRFSMPYQPVDIETPQIQGSGGLHRALQGGVNAGHMTHGMQNRLGGVDRFQNRFGGYNAFTNPLTSWRYE